MVITYVYSAEAAAELAIEGSAREYYMVSAAPAEED